MTDYADSAKRLGQILDGAVARHKMEVAMTDPITTKCAVCGLPVTWEGPRGNGVMTVDPAYKDRCQSLPKSGDYGCTNLIEAQRELTRLSEQDGRRR